MKNLTLILAIASFSAQAAAANPPSWCKGTTFDDDEVAEMSSNDPSVALAAIVKTECTSNQDVAAHRAEADKARDKLGGKLHMNDADWADAVAYAGDSDRAFKADFSTKMLAQATPIDQFKAIHDEFQGVDDGRESPISDALYVADALDGRLSEVGRLAFLDWCVKDESTRPEDDAVKWAICQPDADKLDTAKLAVELRGDTAHDGLARSWLRVRALKMSDDLKSATAARDKLFKKDDTYKKIFDVAQKARADWAKGAGSDGKLLELVLAMDSAAFFHSRKQFDGCEAKTRAALEKAVSTIPAKSFRAMHDVRDDPYKGFANGAAPLLANTPAVDLAAIAFVACQKKSPTADFLAAAIARVPGVRGPRSAALGAVMGATFKFDDMNADGLRYVDFSNRPYARSGATVGSAGGVVRALKPGKDALTVAIEKTFVMQEDCVKEHASNHVARVIISGNRWNVEREMICDKTAMVKHDMTWADFEVDPSQQKLLKPGVMFSAVYGVKVSDVLAVWPSNSATLPSLVLGAPVR
jgi:hypothetical protein